MVSIQNPSVSVKDIWEYANRSLSDNQEVAQLNADVLLNAIVAQNPTADSVASRIRNGIVNDILGQKDKYTVNTKYINQFEPNSSKLTTESTFPWTWTNDTKPLATVIYSYYSQFYEMKNCDLAKLGSIQFKCPNMLINTLSYGLDDASIECIAYNNTSRLPYELGQMHRYNIRSEDGSLSGKFRVESDPLDANNLPDFRTATDYVFPIGHQTPTTQTLSLSAVGEKFSVYLIPKGVNESDIIVNNVSGDYFTNLQLSTYEALPIDLEFELRSGQQVITNFTFRQGEFIHRELQDANVATVPGQTTATLTCLTDVPADVKIPALRRFEVSNLIPVEPTATGE